ncbi:MAG TPA: acyltransferase domain-containing protein [Sphaerochaeta sp.]|nr:acyltransferase domain-containing protein [Sphaerochaeta sp.]
MTPSPDPLLLTRAESEAIERLSERLADTDGHHRRVSSLRRAIEAQETETIGSLLDGGMALYGPLYPLLMVKECLTDVYELYRTQGISDAIRDATLFDIRRWIDEHADRTSGEVGLSQVYWIARHLSCRILQLGSLQFEPKAFGHPYRIYRHRGHSEPLILAEAGIGCNREGYLETEEIAFTTALQEDGMILLAHRVDPITGEISSLSGSYRLDDLSLLSTRETAVLNIHIPKGADLTAESVCASLSHAHTVFPQHEVMVCSSWLLDPALAVVLDRGSNIVRFMRLFAKFPVPFSLPQIYERVFGYGFGIDEVLAFPPQTSLQRRVQEAIKEGVVFRTMGGFILPSAAY